MIYIPFAELVDIEKEIERLKKEEQRLTRELARVNGMLSNEKFRHAKHRQTKIEEEKGKAGKIHRYDGTGERETGTVV